MNTIAMAKLFRETSVFYQKYKNEPALSAGIEKYFIDKFYYKMLCICKTI